MPPTDCQLSFNQGWNLSLVSESGLSCHRKSMIANLGYKRWKGKKKATVRIDFHFSLPGFLLSRSEAWRQKSAKIGSGIERDSPFSSHPEENSNTIGCCFSYSQIQHRHYTRFLRKMLKAVSAK